MGSGGRHDRSPSLTWRRAAHGRRTADPARTTARVCGLRCDLSALLRDYEVSGQYGHEPTIEDYVDTLRRVFGEVRRVLTPEGTCWLNLGDSYGGSWGNYVAPGSTAPTARDASRRVHGRHRPPQSRHRPKNLMGVPWRVVLALQDDGWLLRNAIIWHKPNGMPASARDRLTCRYETVFLLA